MMRAAAIAAGSVTSAGIAWIVAGPDLGREIALGMFGPLVAVAVSWVLIERADRRDPARVRNVMLLSFAGKVVFFGVYVVAMFRVVGVDRVPFVVSFTTHFVVLYVVEAVLLQRLSARSLQQTTPTS